MADAEIDVIRRLLASHPRPTDLSERRKRLDALGAQYPLRADVRVEPVNASGVAAEWTATPEADPSRVVLFLHGGGYISGSIDSHRHMIAQAGREAQARTLAPAPRLAPPGPPLPPPPGLLSPPPPLPPPRRCPPRPPAARPWGARAAAPGAP